MANNIKGIQIEIGGNVGPLNKSLAEVNKSSRDIQKELREVDKLLKFNPKNTELLAQKQKLLGEQVSTTKEKLDKLKEAEKQVQEQFERGEISEQQYRAFQREIVETESKLKHYESQLKSVSDTKKSFGDRMDEVSNKLKAAGDKMTSVGKSMTKGITAPALAAGGAILALATKSGQAADRLLDLSDITGLTTDSIQEWQHVAVVAGVSTEAMTTAVEGLVRRIPQLESEGGKATEGLKKLGLSFDEIKDKSPDEQFDAIIYSLADMEDPLQRNAIGSQLFGGAWKDLAPILGNGTNNIKDMRKEAHELGNVLSNESLNDANDFRIEMDKMKESIKNAGLQIGADLAPILKDTLVPLIQEKLVPAVQGMIEKVREGIKWYQELSPPIQKAIKIIGGIVVVMGPVLVIFGTVTSFVATKLMPAFKLVGIAIGGISAPIAIAIGAVAGLIAIGVALWKNWDTVKEKAGALWSKIKEVFDKIKNFLKNIFNFKWELPKLKMPKISMEGKFSLVPPSVPKFSIKWNKEGGIFKNPTVLPTLAGLQGFAEPSTGGEVIMPLNRLPKLMAEAMDQVGSQGSDIIIENMTVRDDTDIEKIAQRLYQLQNNKRRGKGYAI